MIQKLDWFHRAGEVSDRQWRDVVGVLKTQRRALDLQDLRRQAEALSLDVLLDRALTEAGVGRA